MQIVIEQPVCACSYRSTNNRFICLKITFFSCLNYLMLRLFKEHFQDTNMFCWKKDNLDMIGFKSRSLRIYPPKSQLIYSVDFSKTLKLLYNKHQTRSRLDLQPLIHYLKYREFNVCTTVTPDSLFFFMMQTLQGSNSISPTRVPQGRQLASI